MRSFLKYFALGLVGLVALLLATVWAVNAFDEDLQPEVVALVERAEAEQIAQQGNAYFPLRGLHAPRGQDIEAVGRAFDKADRRAMEEFKKDGDLTRIWPAAPPDFLKFEGESYRLCTVVDDSLYNHGVCKSQAETDRMFEDNDELLRRYYRLLGHRIYEEPATTFAHIDADLIGLMRLANADMQRMLVRGQVDEAARLMSRHLAFWRNALDGKYHLISEPIIRVNYNFSLITLSELLWRYPALLRESELRAALAKPFKPTDAQLQPSMDREFVKVYFVKQGANLLFDRGPGIDRSPVLEWMANRLYQRNSTLNAFHACLGKFYAVRALSGAEYDRALARYQDYELEDSLGSFVNLTGKLALRSICPKGFWLDDLDNYSRFEAKRRLVLLQISLLGSKLQKSRYARLLRSADPSLHDPLTGRPAQWDAARNIIYFEREKGCYGEALWVPLGPVKAFVRCAS